MTDNVDFPAAAAAAAFDATWTVLESAAALVAARSPRYSLDEACDRLGIDADRVRERAGKLRDGADPDA